MTSCYKKADSPQKGNQSGIKPHGSSRDGEYRQLGDKIQKGHTASSEPPLRQQPNK